MCDRKVVPDSSLSSLVSKDVFEPSGVEPGPSPIEVKLMNATSIADVKRALADFYGDTPVA
jgi:hypothetical protein